jgi:HD superfamily phosphohydrolase
MFEKLSRKKVFRDPLYGYITVEYKVISDLIDTLEIQRLRRISQLSGVSRVFQTAEHSRFTHALGAYQMANLVIANVDGMEKVSEYEKVVFLCAALLHDIGHGPYSHAFESVTTTPHEQMTVNIILSDKTDVNKVLSICPTLAADVAGVISHSGKYPLIESLVSSQLDVDRMDYLSRDAYFTGTKYGLVEYKRIIRAMKVIDGKICFKESGLSSIENFFVGRYHMYKQVYYHPRSLSYELIIVGMLRRFIDLVNEGFKFVNSYELLIPLTKNKMLTNKEYTELDDHLIYASARKFMDEDDKTLNDLASRLVKSISFSSTFVDKEEAKQEIYEGLVNKGFDPRYYFFTNKTSQIIYKKDNNDSLKEINIYTKDGKTVELSKYSVLVKALVEGNIYNDNNKVVICPTF